MILVPGYPYVSRQALDAVAKMATIQRPHATPDGRAILALHTPAGRPAYFVVLTERGLNLEHLHESDSTVEVRNVMFPLDAFDDVEKLVEYDHLPEARKDYKVYRRGHKL